MQEYSIKTHGELEPGIHREWLLTNGLGSFACGTVAGGNTRRYHSLLCAAMRPPAERYVMLSRIGEIVQLDGRAQPTYELALNQFEHQWHPRGDRHLAQFDFGQTARWTYQVDGVTITKELLLCWGRNLSGVKYTLKSSGRRVRLELLPFVAMRDFHALRHGTDVPFQTQSWGDHVTITDRKLFLHLSADGANWQDQPYWWYGHTYALEQFRGLDFTEELWNPGRFVLETSAPETATIIWAGTEHFDRPDWNQQLAVRNEALQAAIASLPSAASPAVRKLAIAANDFVVEKTLPAQRRSSTILAGYPWFLDWGRDTMIALPGLLLLTGRHSLAFDVLEMFAQHVSEGMIPNRFDDYTGEPSYNTVDASLWFIHACHEYLRVSGDRARFEATLLPACRAIVEGYRRGTRYKIRMDEGDGLISQGDANTQLTWMDAKCDGIAFTPRQGKPVEINALWYHALVCLGERDLADRVRQSYVERFWISPYRGLADVVEGERRDIAIRPNQVLAVSLPNSPLDREQQRAVMELVRRELLTPYGLRTLARNDARYCPRIEGPPRQRDCAYHNGTVWPWLIGPFVEGYLKVNDFSDAARKNARQWLAPLLEHMDRDCLGQVAEVFDGDPPHRAAGCFAQAWSVAELLRAASLCGA